MPIATRTFRVFVSSTFEDLKEERDALQRDVFPNLRKLCEQHGARFQAIDLRWGVRDEAALDQKTMEICLREIERCQRTGIKPNFIVMLGQRYGWRPLPSRVEAGEFEAVLKQIADGEDRALAESWYQRDDNAVPAEYLLKARVAEWVQSEQWQALETRLHRILRDAAQAAGLSEEARVKFEASATHQEILKGLGATPEDRRHVFAFCRNAPDKDCDPDLVNLKRLLHERLPAGTVLNYEPGDFAKLCREVEQTLRAVIESEAAGFESRPALALEIEAHDAFARERALVFGREDVLEGIAAYLREGGPRPLVVHGPSGSGKSAVMAQASERSKTALKSAVLIRRFIGVSPESSSGLTLLRGLCEQIGEAYGVTGDVPVDFNGVVRVLRERMAQATSERPLVVFLDALDQLGKDDAARSLFWMSATLPAHCRMVLSATELAPALRECELREIEALGAAGADEALDHWLAEAKRTLTSEQRQKLLYAFNRCGLTLYLKLAFEEARLWPSSLPTEECLLGEGVEGVIDTLLDRLSQDVNHGQLLVSRGLGYLAAARYGLTEDEMLDVLSTDEGVWQDFSHRAHHTPPEHRPPVIVWSRLFLDLEPYLAERSAPGGTVTSFYHRQLAERVAASFLAEGDGSRSHKSLATYFAKRANWLDNEARKLPNTRKTTELPWQQRAASLWREAEATLLDWPFLFAKVESGLVLDLDLDYQALIKDAPPATFENRDAVSLIGGALRLSMHVVAADARQFASQMVGRLLGFREIQPIQRFIDEVTAKTPGSWLRPLKATLYPPGKALTRTLEGHSDCVSSVAVTADGRRAVSASDRDLKVWDLNSGLELRELVGHFLKVHSVTLTPDGCRAISVREDGMIEVWDIDSGVLLRRLEGFSEGSSYGPYGVAVTADGRRAVSHESRDATIRVWDLDNGLALHTLKSYSGSFYGVAVTPDGRRVVLYCSGGLPVFDLDNGIEVRSLQGHSDAVISGAISADGKYMVTGSEDKTAKVWDLDSGMALHTLEGHTDAVTSVAITADGKHVVTGSNDRTIRVWDLDNGRAMRTLDGHSGAVTSVAITADGKRVVTGSMDNTVKVWDLDNSLVLPRLSEGHTMPVFGVAITADGRRAVSASGDRTLKVWDLSTGCALRTLEGHSGWVFNVALTPEGRRAISASEDNTLRVWDLDSGRMLRTLEGHTGWVRSVAVTLDGRRAVSASLDRTVRVWDLGSGRMLRTLDGIMTHVRSVAVTADGQRVILASEDKTLEVWDLGSGQVNRPHGLSFLLMRKCWELQIGRLLRTLEGHTGLVGGVMLTGDGSCAVSAAYDKTLRIWDLESEVPVVAYSSDSDLLDLAASSDGSLLLAGDRSGNIHFLRLEGRPIEFMPRFLTLTRRWEFGCESDAASTRSGQWEPCSGVTCFRCGKRFPAPPELQKAIKNSRAGAMTNWNCPTCGADLQFYPFVVDLSGKPELFRSAEGPEMSVAEHLAEAARLMRFVGWAWLIATTARCWWLSPHSWRAVVETPPQAALMAYPLICWAAWRFSGRYLRGAREKVPFWAGLAILPAVVWLIGVFVKPPDRWLAKVWQALPRSDWLLAGKAMVLLAAVCLSAILVRYYLVERGAQQDKRKVVGLARRFGESARLIIVVIACLPSLIDATVLFLAEVILLCYLVLNSMMALRRREPEP